MKTTTNAFNIPRLLRTRGSRREEALTSLNAESRYPGGREVPVGLTLSRAHVDTAPDCRQAGARRLRRFTVGEPPANCFAPAARTLKRPEGRVPGAVSKCAPLFRRAFTLIEMLVVIAIIAVLAAMIVGLTAVAGRNKIQSRVKAELNQLVGAIESYHKKHGFYPPDHARNPPASTLSTNQTTALYYELTGTEPTNAVAAAYAALGVTGIANTDATTQKGQNFHPNLKPSGFAPWPAMPNVLLLVVPSRGPSGDYNPWHYNSSSPEHNTETFDLWAEVIIDGKTNTIGNWKD